MRWGRFIGLMLFQYFLIWPIVALFLGPAFLAFAVPAVIITLVVCRGHARRN